MFNLISAEIQLPLHLVLLFPTMADNTRMKELQAEYKRHADLIEKQATAFDKFGQDCHTQFGHIDSRFEHLESKMDEVLQALLQN